MKRESPMFGNVHATIGIALLAARGKSPPSHRDRRGARLTRREEGEYREYSTDEQRSQPGCRVGRMQGVFCHGLLALLTAGTASATDLAVHIDNLGNSEGFVRVALHQRVDGVDFPDEAGAVAGTFRRAVAGTMRFVFTDLPPGDYAVAAFHDQNGDGELGTTVLGIPTEPYGFSNDARGFMGPASFENAAVTVSADSAALSISIRISGQSPSALFTR